MSDWTVDTLKEYVDQMFAERRAEYDQRFKALQGENALALASTEKAVEKAERAAEKRFEAVNEFRAQLADQQKTYITRAEAQISLDRNTQDIKAVTDRVNTSQGRGAGFSAGWGYLVGVISLVLLVVELFWKK